MADNFGTTQADLIGRLNDNLPAGYTTATFKKPNAPFNTPKKTKWLRGTARLNPTNNVTPDGYKRTFGIYTIDIYFPKNTGDVAQLADAQIIKDLYENQRFGNTACYEASINIVGEDESWYVVQVDVLFYYEGT